MVRVDDLVTAADFYERVFGLRPRWRDEQSLGMGMAESEVEIVLHTMDIPRGREVNYLVDDVREAVEEYQRQGCAVLVEPFEIAIGLCAVVGDPYGNSVCILDMSKGPRTG